jgi:polyhydroxyalkanoate synthesis regulator phasin
MTDDPIDWISRSGKKAKGKRPHYFAAPESDRMLSILMAVVGELSVTRERLDTLERLLEKNGSISREAIEQFVPDRDEAYERGLMTREYIARVMRAVQQDMESMDVPEPSLEDVSKQIRDM